MRKILSIMAIMTLFTALSLPASAAKGEVELAYVEWAETVASTNVVKTVLEDMGYDVDIMSVSAAAMWKGTAAGDVDGFTGAWLPVTHSDYKKQLEGQLDLLGKNLTGARIGLAVPEYVDVDSIEDLQENADKFNNEIVGIDPGAGIMQKTDKAIDAYNLDDFEIIGSSGAMMTATLKTRIENNEPVVVTAWTPHWMFSRWDLKYLKDPKKVYGEAEYIGTVARKGLKQDKPEVYNLLKNFNWSLDDCQQVMLWAEDSSPEEAAARWVEENQDKVAAWKE
ncbi:MAG: glycine betaine ABC transporter substrate-binding protein [Desulfonatronovibrionaceae bacterium]